MPRLQKRSDPRATAGETRRKGCTRRADIPAALLRALNAGREEPLTLSEWLAVDARKLMRAIIPEVGLESHAKGLIATARKLAPCGVMDRQRGLAAALHEAFRDHHDREQIFARLAAHTSSVVREWAALTLTADPTLTLEQRLAGARRFAADSNAGVREIAWMSYRPYLEAELPRALELLQQWVRDADANIRRCAVESTRPRGVWCAHLSSLKDGPELALPLLEAANADPSRYVRLSIANWLNDASKHRPQWVRKVCARWIAESPVPETIWIAEYAQRTLRKASAVYASVK